MQLAKAVADSQESASEYDLTRLANTVEGYAPKPNYIVKSALNMELIWCPPGSFIRGDKDEKHSVILTKGFYLGKYEVTQEEYEKIMGNNPSRFKGEKLPIETVSWNDAVEFCEALTKKELVPNAWKFTLPSDAQWEYACRAGTTTIYSWGENVDARYINEKPLEQTKPGGAYLPNTWGFFDMHGNVREWSYDYFGPYQGGVQIDPHGLLSGTRRVCRGGQYGNGGSAFTRSALRRDFEPGQFSKSIGFRLCLAPAR